MSEYSNGARHDEGGEVLALHVDIVLDIACVWSYLGYSRFTRAADRHRAAGRRIEVAFHPFQVAPEASTAGEPLTRVHQRDLAPRVEEKVAYVRSLAAADGIELDFDRAVFANTFDAHRLIALAAQEGAAEFVVERLFRAYFVEGRNVAEGGVLREIAAEIGVTFNDDKAEDVRVALRHSREVITGSVPTFVIDKETVLTGAQSEGDLFAALDRAMPSSD